MEFRFSTILATTICQRTGSSHDRSMNEYTGEGTCYYRVERPLKWKYSVNSIIATSPIHKAPIIANGSDAVFDIRFIKDRKDYPTTALTLVFEGLLTSSVHHGEPSVPCLQTRPWSGPGSVPHGAPYLQA